MQLTFHGDSDDIRLVFADDKVILDASGYDSDFRSRYIEVARDDGAFLAVFHYDTCWSISIRQLDEGAPIPPWLEIIGVEASLNGYSADLIIEVPDDVELKEVD